MSRLTTILAATVSLVSVAWIAHARDTTYGLSVAIVSNGVVSYKIPNGPDGLELSSNSPGTITVTSGSNSVTVRGPAITLSGAAMLAPYSTPGVRVMPDNEGGYTAVLDTVLSVNPDPEMPEDAAGRLAQELAQVLAQDLAQDIAKEFADADFGDRSATGRCMAPLPKHIAPPNSVSPSSVSPRSLSP